MNNSLTEGKILSPLVKFTLPILGALILQSLYGAVDLFVVGKFGETADISAVATGSQIMNLFLHFVTSFAIGTTVLVGRAIGEGKRNDAGRAIGAGIEIFAVLGILITLIGLIFPTQIATLMNAPEAAFDRTISYIRVCCSGYLFIAAYNLLGGVFKGLGDSKTPLMAVAIATVFNIIGDLVFVAGFGMGTKGAALATIMAQGLSVIICLFIINRRGLPFDFGKESFKNTKSIIATSIKLGAPVAIQSIMVSLSFLVIISLVNSVGLIVSAGLGVAEKVCAFIMLIPSAFAQALAAYVAQNLGAKKPDRADKGLIYAIATSFTIAIFIAAFSFFRGDILTGIFSNDPEVILAGWEYLKAYAIDVLLTSFMFCFVGYFNGCGATAFVMTQGVLSAFGIRIPVSYFMSKQVPVSLFKMGLATPCSTAFQIILCVSYFIYRKKKYQ